MATKQHSLCADTEMGRMVTGFNQCWSVSDKYDEANGGLRELRFLERVITVMDHRI